MFQRSKKRNWIYGFLKMLWLPLVIICILCYAWFGYRPGYGVVAVPPALYTFFAAFSRMKKAAKEKRSDNEKESSNQLAIGILYLVAFAIFAQRVMFLLADGDSNCRHLFCLDYYKSNLQYL
jgi:hypothetical protein